jgi:peptidyl-prolyl cis-trans isomerase A (cyclophilin A)
MEIRRAQSTSADLERMPRRRRGGVRSAGMSRGLRGAAWSCAFLSLLIPGCGDAAKAPPSGETPTGSGATSKGGTHADLLRGSDVPKEKAKAVVRLKTSEGDVVVELDRRKAPDTVENFLAYVRDGFYAGTVFDRVVGGVLVQGGARDASGAPKKAGPAIVHEGENALSHKRGTIAMWRDAADPHSARAEFFFNLADNDGKKQGARNFDFQSETRGPGAWGYCVFGKVKDAASLDVIDRLGKTPTRENPAFPGEASLPTAPPRILGAEIVSE